MGYLETEEIGVHDPNAASAANFVAGLVPDGVKHVAIHESRGSTITLSVHENVYMDETIGHVNSVTFIGPDGTMTVGSRGP